jgi:hypothetical protein
MMGFYEYGKQSYGYVKGEDFLSGCVTVRRIVFHEVCFCYSTIIIFVAWRELLCLLFIGVLTLSGSTLEKNGGSVKSIERRLQTARVTQSSDAQNGVDSFNGISHYRNVLGCTYCFYTPTFLL